MSDIRPRDLALLDAASKRCHEAIEYRRMEASRREAEENERRRIGRELHRLITPAEAEQRGVREPRLRELGRRILKLPHHPNGIMAEYRVSSDELCPFDRRLGDQEPVEGVFVDWRQSFDGQGVRQGDR